MGGEPGKKLVGWKELAEYLGTSARTVQRWEIEKGLPVQRVPGSNGHSVFADSRELDRWLASGKAGAAVAGNTPAASPGRVSREAVTHHPDRTRGIRATWLRRHPALRVAAVVALAVAVVVLGANLVRARSAKWHKGGAVRPPESATGMPAISSVSAIEPKANQVIVIKGQRLGVHTYYANGDTAYIAIRDQTARWAAGRIIPQNWDEVTLNVAHWTNSEIVVTGFAGAYGQHWWKLTPGDEIEVAIWNPQTQAGPATYHLTVASRQLAQK
jgi:hypothetical protein